MHSSAAVNVAYATTCSTLLRWEVKWKAIALRCAISAVVEALICVVFSLCETTARCSSSVRHYSPRQLVWLMICFAENALTLSFAARSEFPCGAFINIYTLSIGGWAWLRQNDTNQHVLKCPANILIVSCITTWWSCEFKYTIHTYLYLSSIYDVNNWLSLPSQVNIFLSA